MHHVDVSQSRRAQSKRNLKTLQMLAASGVFRSAGSNLRPIVANHRHSPVHDARPHEAEHSHLSQSRHTMASPGSSCTHPLLHGVSQLIRELPKRLWTEFASGPHKA
jgi:hypothetical protein